MAPAGALSLLLLTSFLASSQSLRFNIDRKECFTQHVAEEGSMVHGSYVITSYEDTWSSGHVEKAGVDLTVEAPAGYHVYSARQRSEDKFSFVAVRKGDYKFCFTNNSPIHESIAFDIHVGHHTPTHEEVAKDEHFEPLVNHIRSLEDKVMSLFYECRWLFAQAERQAELSKITGRRLIVKAVVQSLALVATSALQVYLLRRLFERKLGQSRV